MDSTPDERVLPLGKFRTPYPLCRPAWLLWLLIPLSPSQQAAQEKRLKQLEEEARKKDPSKAFSLKLPDILPYFSVSPVDVELRPWSAVTLVFKGQASKIGTYASVFNHLVCFIWRIDRLGHEQVFVPNKMCKS